MPIEGEVCVLTQKSNKKKKVICLKRCDFKSKTAHFCFGTCAVVLYTLMLGSLELGEGDVGDISTIFISFL